MKCNTFEGEKLKTYYIDSVVVDIFRLRYSESVFSGKVYNLKLYVSNFLDYKVQFKILIQT